MMLSFTPVFPPALPITFIARIYTFAFPSTMPLLDAKAEILILCQIVHLVIHQQFKVMAESVLLHFAQNNFLENQTTCFHH